MDKVLQLEVPLLTRRWPSRGERGSRGERAGLPSMWLTARALPYISQGSVVLTVRKRGVLKTVKSAPCQMTGHLMHPEKRRRKKSFETSKWQLLKMQTS